jgi:hypothetical protein
MGDAAAQAYRELRRVQHQARLDEKPTQVAPDVVAVQALAVRELWGWVMVAAEAPAAAAGAHAGEQTGVSTTAQPGAQGAA